MTTTGKIALFVGGTLFGSLYYREVVFATQFEFMCYTVEDAVDWLSTPTA